MVGVIARIGSLFHPNDTSCLVLPFVWVYVFVLFPSFAPSLIYN
jgi:hypothetical protein